MSISDLVTPGSWYSQWKEMDTSQTGFVFPVLAVYLRWTVPQKCLHQEAWDDLLDIETSLQQTSTFGQRNPNHYTSAPVTEHLPNICVPVSGSQEYYKLWGTLRHFNITHFLGMAYCVSVDTDFHVLLRASRDISNSSYINWRYLALKS